MVTIRLARAGAKRRPFYHLVVIDGRNPRDGGFIERIGFFNPIATASEERLRIDAKRVEYWRGQGAKTSQSVDKLLRQSMRAVEQTTAQTTEQTTEQTTDQPTA